MAMRTVVLRTLGAAGLVVALASPALAQAPASPPWRFSWTPIGAWGMGIEGPVTVRGFSRDLDVSFDDLFDHLQGSFGTSLTASKGRYGGFFNLSYLKIGQDSIVTAAFEPVNFSIKWVTVEFGGNYAVVAKPEVVFSVLGGIRFTGLKGEIVTTEDETLLAESEGVDWIDPFIGANVVKPIGEKFALSLKGDVGGFNISESTSKPTWTISPAASYRFPISGGKRNLVLSGGYRFTSIDFEGEGPDVFQMDVDMSGPLLGLTIVF
jgi:hypothetical protein